MEGSIWDQKDWPEGASYVILPQKSLYSLNILQFRFVGITSAFVKPNRLITSFFLWFPSYSLILDLLNTAINHPIRNSILLVNSDITTTITCL